MRPSSQGPSVPVVQAQPALVQVTGGASSQTPDALQYPEQQPAQLSSALQVASQAPPLSVQGGGPQTAAGWQLPGPPGSDGSVRQQMRPSSQAPCTPPLQAQPSPVQAGGAQFAVHVPAPPGTSWPFWQQTSPVSQAPSTPPLQSHPWPVQGGGAHCASGSQVPAPPGIDCPP